MMTEIDPLTWETPPAAEPAKERATYDDLTALMAQDEKHQAWMTELYGRNVPPHAPERRESARLLGEIGKTWQELLQSGRASNEPERERPAQDDREQER